ncbi:MAG TPA: MOP flippase family protein [Nitrococcus sp.]|nr:MOP flippase family protein [Nitrococcus sp.]
MSLIRQAASGASWTAASTAATVTLQFFQLAVLARLLSPRDFGLMAMLVVVTGFAQIFAGMSISQSIIYRHDTTRDQLSTLFWLNVLAGGCVFLVLIAISPLVALMYGEPRLQGLIVLAALAFLIIPFGQQFEVLLQKELRFKPLCTIEIAATVLGVGVAIGTALIGFNVLALIFGQLANNAVKSLGLAAIGWRDWRPGLHFRRADLPGYLGFGLYQMASNSINFFNSRVDQLLLGILLGAQALGFYSMAWNLAIQPVNRINPILTRVAFPVFAKVQHDQPRLRRGYLLVIRLVSVINFPLLLGLAATAPVLVPIVFGNQWQASVPLVQVLALAALLRTVANPVGALLLSQGRADMEFYFNALKVFFQLPCLLVAAWLGGVLGVALALLGLQLVNAGLCYYLLVRRTLGPCFRRHISGIAPAFIAAAIMGACVWGFAALLHVPTALHLSEQILGGAALYLSLILLLQRRQLLEFKQQIFPSQVRPKASS